MNTNAVILHIRPKIGSNYTIWCFESLNGTPVLQHLFQRLQKNLSTPDTEFAIVYHDDFLTERLQGLDGVKLFHTKALNRLKALSEFLQLNPSFKTLLVFPEGALFPDCRLAEEMLKLHQTERVEGTSSAGYYPTGLLPEIFESAAIHRLLKLGLPEDMDADFFSVMVKANQFFAQDKAMRFKVSLFSPARATNSPTLDQLPAEVLIRDGLSSHAASQTLAHLPEAAPDSTHAMRFKEELRTLEYEPVFRFTVPKPPAGRIPILYSTVFGAYSGAEECFYDLVSQVDRSRFYPLVVLPTEGVLSEKFRSAGIPVEIAYRDLEKLSVYDTRYFETLLKDYAIRLVHINCQPSSPSLVLAAHEAGIPIVEHVRAFIGSHPPEWMKFASRIIVISDVVKEDLLRSNLDPRRIVRIYDGQNLESFKPGMLDKATIRAEAGIESDRPVIAMIARICAQKRQLFLLDALMDVVKKVPHLLVLLVGESQTSEMPYNAAVHQKVEQYHLQSNVRFWGFEKNIAKIHAMSDGLVLCTENEPLGHCIQEAMAMGVPVVAPNRGGQAEVLKHEESALLYDAKAPKNLAAELIRLLQDVELQKKLSGHALKTIHQFDIKTHVAEVSRVYEELLTKPSR